MLTILRDDVLDVIGEEASYTASADVNYTSLYMLISYISYRISENIILERQELSNSVYRK